MTNKADTHVSDSLEMNILQLADMYAQEMISIRRDLHMHPELGLEEHCTAKVVARYLRELGIEVHEGVGETGVVGIIRGYKPNGGRQKTVMLRADMDALALQEVSEAEYKSVHQGVMHACGHDAHTAWLLGAARILSQQRQRFSGNVKLVFQPAEEGLGGAKRMIEAGVLENPKVDAVFGAHVWPTLDSGFIGVKAGPIMASPASFSICIKGQGGHASTPHLCIDPISLGMQVYTAFQTILSRKIDANESLVISVTQFHAGTAHNIIPDHATMNGTVRCFNRAFETRIPELMENMIKSIVESQGGTYTFDYRTYYPAVINDVQMTGQLKASAVSLFGDSHVVELEEPNMAGEDFSFYLQEVPGTYFMIGNRNELKGLTAMVHNPSFDVDEDIIPRTAALFAKAAIDYLRG